MKQLAAFLGLLARPAMFLWTLFCLGVVGFLLVAMKDPDFPVAEVDTVFAAAFMLPAAAGLLCGLSLQELQHSSFVWHLPGSRRKLALGFTATGTVFTLVAIVLPNLESVHPAPSLLVLGIAAFFLGSNAIDPTLPGLWIALIGIALFVLFDSAPIGAYWEMYPVIALSMGMAWIAISVVHKFRSRTFRRLQFIPVGELPGAFASRHAERTAREKLANRPAAKRVWTRTEMGSDHRNWTRAAFYEISGVHGLRDLLKILSPTVWILLILVIDVAFSIGDRGWFETLAIALHHGLFMPPTHVESIPYHLVAVWVAVPALGLTLSAPMALDPARHYPLSRHDLSRVTHRFLLGYAIRYLLFITVAVMPIGIVGAWLSGTRVELDYVPLCLRAALVTMILLPIPQWIRLQSSGPSRGMDQPTQVIVATLFVVVVAIWSTVSPRILTDPVQELVFLAVLFLGAHLILRNALDRRFRSSDLV